MVMTSTYFSWKYGEILKKMSLFSFIQVSDENDIFRGQFVILNFGYT